MIRRYRWNKTARKEGQPKNKYLRSTTGRRTTKQNTQHPRHPPAGRNKILNLRLFFSTDFSVYTRFDKLWHLEPLIIIIIIIHTVLIRATRYILTTFCPQQPKVLLVLSFSWCSYVVSRIIYVCLSSWGIGHTAAAAHTVYRYQSVSYIPVGTFSGNRTTRRAVYDE